MQKGSNSGLEQEFDRDFPIAIAAMPATAQQRRLAAGVVVVLFAAVAVIAPFARVNVGEIGSFIPAVQAVLSTADLLTAVLLFVQYSFQPQTALLALGSGYLCSASFALTWVIEFCTEAPNKVAEAVRL